MEIDSYISGVSSVVSAGFLLAAIVFLIDGIVHSRKAEKILPVPHTDTSNTPKAKQLWEVARGKSDLRPRDLGEGSELTNSAAELGMANIEFLFKKVLHLNKKPAYIFGINKGGILLAEYLASRVGPEEAIVIRCEFPKESKELMYSKTNVDGPIIILDDVARSGSTIAAAEKILREEFRTDNVYSATLVVTSTSATNEDFKRYIDYTAWLTEVETIRLPWTDDLTPQHEKYFDSTTMDQMVHRIDKALYPDTFPFPFIKSAA